MKFHQRPRTCIKWTAAATAVALLALCIASNWYVLTWRSSQSPFFVVTQDQFRIAVDALPGASTRPLGWHFKDNDPRNFPFLWWFDGHRDPSGWMLGVPLWLLAAVCAAVAAIAWRFEVLARRRARQHLCPKCQYDRTGLAAGAVCPECGT